MACQSRYGPVHPKSLTDTTTSAGNRARSCRGVMPLAASQPAGPGSKMMSAVAASRSSRSRPAAVARSASSARLPALWVT